MIEPMPNPPETPVTETTLLLVDDEPNILSSLRRLFRADGYKILTAGSGHEGLAVLEQSRVDLIISDMRMPEMDGAQFLEQVAQRWPEVMRILLTGFSDVTSTIQAINQGRIYRYITKPWDDNDLKLNVRHALERKRLEEERHALEQLTCRQNEELKTFNATLENRVKARTEELGQTMAMLEHAHEVLKENYAGTVKIFANLLEVREGLGAGHSRRVAEKAHDLALRLGMTPPDARTVLFAGLLHDIGKIGLPDRLLGKPYNALPAADRERVEKHPIVGQALLMSLDTMHEVGTFIRGHHERYDGKGYPDGLSGAAIPLGARILAVVNDFDGLQSGSLATQRFSGQEALQFLRENAGKRYDPKVVEVFIQLLGQAEPETLRQEEVTLKAASLESGMVLSRDLTTKEGILLLSKDHVLDLKLVRLIQSQGAALGQNIDIHVYRNKRA